MQTVYELLAYHFSMLGMGMPYREELVEVLKQTLTPQEAEVALLLPTKVAPLQPAGVDEIARHSSLPRAELVEILENITAKGLLFTGKTTTGEKGYALQQLGYGFPQSFYWKGEDTPQANNLAIILGKYFNRQVIGEGYAGSDTKPYRYVPLKETIHHEIQAVYPYHMIERIVEQAKVYAVANCPCRVIVRMRGKGCNHPLEVCIKFDDMAEYLIDRGLGREITKDEALKILKESEEAGLVHFVDNALGEIKHICNCCGCACWNVGTIKRRKIPRDVLMATYFMRETDADECTGCGNCVEVCPVDALTLEGDLCSVDEEWCIGCGVCVPQCSNEAAKLRLRTDIDQTPLRNFKELQERILEEKGLKKLANP